MKVFFLERDKEYTVILERKSCFDCISRHVVLYYGKSRIIFADLFYWILQNRSSIRIQTTLANIPIIRPEISGLWFYQGLLGAAFRIVQLGFSRKTKLKLVYSGTNLLLPFNYARLSNFMAYHQILLTSEKCHWLCPLFLSFF